jgi:membrane protease YdiL (CAAX protease family)
METQKGHSLFQSVVLHLLPGALATMAYLGMVPLAMQNGYPALLALLLAAGLVIVPFQLGYLLWQKRRAQNKPVIGLREPLPKWQYVVLPLAMLIWAFLASGALSLLDGYLAKAWFNWLPEWFFFLDVDQFNAFPREVLLPTFWIGLLINGFVGPIVEELYFRGHLLPRLPAPRDWSPFINISLFSLYHFWSPWQFFSRILWLLPWGYLVWKKQNFYLMMIAHCAANVLGWLLFWSQILGRS